MSLGRVFIDIRYSSIWAGRKKLRKKNIFIIHIKAYLCKVVNTNDLKACENKNIYKFFETLDFRL